MIFRQQSNKITSRVTLYDRKIHKNEKQATFTTVKYF